MIFGTERIFYGLTTNIMFPSTCSAWYVSLTIVYRPHSDFIPIAISNASSAIDIETSFKPSRVLIRHGISRTIYFAHFSLSSARHAPNVCTNLELNSCNCCNVVPVVGTRTKPVLTGTNFQIVRISGSTAFARFCSTKVCSFLCGNSFPSLIINLLSDLPPPTGDGRKSLVVTLGLYLGWVWGLGLHRYWF